VSRLITPHIVGTRICYFLHFDTFWEAFAVHVEQIRQKVHSFHHLSLIRENRFFFLKPFIAEKKMQKKQILYKKKSIDIIQEVNDEKMKATVLEDPRYRFSPGLDFEGWGEIGNERSYGIKS